MAMIRCVISVVREGTVKTLWAISQSDKRAWRMTLEGNDLLRTEVAHLPHYLRHLKPIPASVYQAPPVAAQYMTTENMDEDALKRDWEEATAPIVCLELPIPIE